MNLDMATHTNPRAWCVLLLLLQYTKITHKTPETTRTNKFDETHDFEERRETRSPTAGTHPMMFSTKFCALPAFTKKIQGGK